MNTKPVSVCYTIWNKAHLIPQIVAGLKKSFNVTQDHFLFLFDNCTDDSRAVFLKEIQDLGNNWQIITNNNEDLFEVKANNFLLKRIVHDQAIPELNKNAIILFQDDIIADDPDIKRKIKNILTWDNVGLIGGRSGFELNSTDFPERPVHKVSNWEHLPSQVNSQLPKDAASVKTFLNRGPLVFTKKLIERVGYLDESYYPQWGDDLDYCAKATFEHHLKNVVFECNVESKLEWGGTRSSESKLKKGKHMKKNWDLFVSKWGKYLK